MFLEGLIIVLVALAGYGIGLLQGGININIQQRPPQIDKKEGYNPSTEDVLPPEMKQYYENTMNILK